MHAASQECWLLNNPVTLNSEIIVLHSSESYCPWITVLVTNFIHIAHSVHVNNFYQAVLIFLNRPYMWCTAMIPWCCIRVQCTFGETSLYQAMANLTDWWLITQHARIYTARTTTISCLRSLVVTGVLRFILSCITLCLAHPGFGSTLHTESRSPLAGLLQPIRYHQRIM